MKFLSTVLALAVSSAAPALADTHTNPYSGGASCAAHLLAHDSNSGCAVEQTLRLTPRQKQRVQTIRNQSKRALASLKLQLKRLDHSIGLAKHHGATPRQLRRLQQRRALLVKQIHARRARAVARVNAMLTPKQKQRCARLTRPGLLAPPRQAGVTVRRIAVPAHARSTRPAVTVSRVKMARKGTTISFHTR